jgi:hypothetical protein
MLCPWADLGCVNLYSLTEALEAPDDCHGSGFPFESFCNLARRSVRIGDLVGIANVGPKSIKCP